MIQGQDMRGNAIVVDAFVPLANMFGYVNTLRGTSQGRAQFTMVYDHYSDVEPNVRRMTSFLRNRNARLNFLCIILARGKHPQQRLAKYQ